ncbi:MAG: methionyl-tRNA formyltransferase [Pseudobdellovibrionaceae bacterium]|jgi:methionyl-tRNA formyltransferase|nr:methionyl-tRNA formyltransferase [Pseudobdellovibrionaceae bacterium]
MTDPFQKLRVIFMGTPDFSVAALERLISHPKIDVVAVYTQPPRPAGRGQQLRLSPVHACAQSHKIPVYTPVSFRKEPDAIPQFAALEADVAVVAAYGLILPEAILKAPQHGCLNIHASLLPRWRGAAPIQRAILAGDTESGITIMQMDVGLDTGDMILKGSVPISDRTTGAILHDDLARLGANLVCQVLDLLIESKPIPKEAQNESMTCYASMLQKEEGHIQWEGETSSEIDRRIRAFTPWPGCWAEDSSGKRFKIIEGRACSSNVKSKAGTILNNDGEICCKDGSVYQILKIQPESAKPMNFQDAVNGGRIKTGQVFS